MTISAFLCLTNPQQRRDPYMECIKSALNLVDELVIIDGISNDGSIAKIKALKDPRIKIFYYPWPEEFDWAFIGHQFDRGYKACTGDWVIHLDSDYMIHEDDVGRIRRAFEAHPQAPALSFWKYQFIRPHRYNIKSRLVIAVNKSVYGNRISFTGGHDLCAPALDGQYLDPGEVPEARVPFYNYDWLCKTKQIATHDLGRFARAYHRSFNEYKLGGPDNDSALRKFMQMQIGRANKSTKTLALDEHPAAIRDTLRGLTPIDFGYDGWGVFNERVPYAQ